MAERCPSCGQELPGPRLLTAEALIAAMKIPPPPPTDPKSRRRWEATRDVYGGYEGGKIPTGRFWITYGGGETTREAVETALSRGLIRRKYDDFCGMWCLNG